MATISLNGQALALHQLATNGLITRTGAATVAGRTLTVGNGLSALNGDGVSGNPWITPIAQSVAVNSSITINSSNYTTYFNKILLASTATSLTASFDTSIPDGFQCSINNIGAGFTVLSSNPALLATGNKTLSAQYDSGIVYKASGSFYAIGTLV